MNDYEELVLTAIIEAHGISVGEAMEIINSHEYMFYEVNNYDEFIDTLIDDGIFGEIPSNLVNYLDYDKLARDLTYDGYIMTSVGIIHID